MRKGDTMRQKIYDSMMNRDLPEYMIDGVQNYVCNGIPGGSFLTSVFENDLMGAYANGDNLNTALLRDWTMLIYNDLPTGCHGSKEKVNDWIEARGLDGR